VASSYASALKSDPSSYQDSEDVFFIKLDYGTSQQTFSKYHLKTVPLIIHIPPNYGDEEEEVYDLNQMNPRAQYQVPQVPTAENMEGFVRERTAIQVRMDGWMNA